MNLQAAATPVKRGTSKVRAEGRRWVIRASTPLHDQAEADLSPRAAKLWARIEYHARVRSWCYPGNDQLHKPLGCELRQLKNLLAELEGAGIIARVMTDEKRSRRLGIIMLRRLDPDQPACTTDDEIRGACAALRHDRLIEKWNKRPERRPKACPGIKVGDRIVLPQMALDDIPSGSTEPQCGKVIRGQEIAPTGGQSVTPHRGQEIAPRITESSTPDEVEKDPPPRRGPEGGRGLSSTPEKTEDPGTNARSSNSKAVPDPAQQTPPVPPAPPEAARIKAEVRVQAEAEGLPAEASAKLARRAEDAATRGELEADVLEATAAAIGRWGRGDDGARDLTAVMLKRFDETVDRARRHRRANDPDATWDEIPKDQQAEFRERAGAIFSDISWHQATDGGAAAAEFHAQAGRTYQEVRVTGRAVREFQRATGYRNPHCGPFFQLPDELKYRALIDFAWAEWHLGRGERDLAVDRLRAMGDAVKAHQKYLEEERREREARQKVAIEQSRAKAAEEKAIDEAKRQARREWSLMAGQASLDIHKACEELSVAQRADARCFLAKQADSLDAAKRIRKIADMPKDRVIEAAKLMAKLFAAGKGTLDDIEAFLGMA